MDLIFAACAGFASVSVCGYALGLLAERLEQRQHRRLRRIRRRTRVRF